MGHPRVTPKPDTKPVAYKRHTITLTVEALQEYLAKAETSPERRVTFHYFAPVDAPMVAQLPAVASGS